jgi:hypothetical protein
MSLWLAHSTGQSLPRRCTAFVKDLVRSAGTHLYGRRMYETMAVWEADPSLPEQSPVMADFARLWQAVDKIVYFRTLKEVWTGRTSLERDFDPQAVREFKARDWCGARCPGVR